MTESAALPVPARSDHIAAAPRANEPSADAQASRPRPAGGLRPSQVPPVLGETTRPTGSPSPARGRAHHQLQRLRPSGAPAGAALPLARPSMVPARPVQDVLRGSGQPLAGPLKEEMQVRLGADFSDVRVHTDGDARASAAEVGARAYTCGSHIVIGDGGTDKHTLAHELTHVFQQRQGSVAGTDHGNGFKVSDPSDAYEEAAEANAAQVMRAPLSQHRLAAAQTSATHPIGDTTGKGGGTRASGPAATGADGTVVQRMELTMRGEGEPAQDLPAGDNEVDTGPMGDCVSVVLLWNLQAGLYQNVRGFHGAGGFLAINLDSLFAGVPNAAGTLMIACMGGGGSRSGGSGDPDRVQDAHRDRLGSAQLQIFEDHGRYTVARNGTVQATG